MAKYTAGQFAYLLSKADDNRQLIQIVEVLCNQEDSNFPMYTVELIDAKGSLKTVKFLCVYDWQLQPVDILY